MSQAQESRPSSDTRAAQETVGETWTPSYGLGRRFDAALRLPPLECRFHHDPMVCYWVRCDYLDAELDDDDDGEGGWCPTRAMSWQQRELAAAGWIA